MGNGQFVTQLISKQASEMCYLGIALENQYTHNVNLTRGNNA